MSQFSHQTADIVVDGNVAKPYFFKELLTKPTGFFRPATEANKQYAAALLALSKRRAKKAPKDPLVALKRVRKENVVLVARFCLQGWENQKDEAGNDIEFTPEAGLDFLQTLARDADWVFDRLHAWLTNPDNFSAEDLDIDGDVDDEFDFAALDEIIASDGEGDGDSLGKSSAKSSSGKSDTKGTGTA